jgi:hypothetical protein
MTRRLLNADLRTLDAAELRDLMCIGIEAHRKKELAQWEWQQREGGFVLRNGRLVMYRDDANTGYWSRKLFRLKQIIQGNIVG